jgi:hypothetical protein
MTLTAFFALTAAICVLSTAGCVLIVRNAVRDMGSPAADLRLRDAQIKSLRDSLELVSTELEHLAQRVKMQRVRNATDHAIKSRPDGDMPDPFKSPDEWRSAMNRKMAKQKMGAQ